MKWARIIENMAIDVVTRHPSELFTPNLAAEFVTVPDMVEHGWLLQDGVWSAPPVVEMPEPELPMGDLETAYSQKLSEIISGSDAYATLLERQYSKLEVLSWNDQRQQAEQVLSGAGLPSDALLAVFAAANGVDLMTFAQKVMANVLQAEALTKIIVGQQQAYEKQLKDIMAATTTTDVDKITAINAMVIQYVLPS